MVPEVGGDILKTHTTVSEVEDDPNRAVSATRALPVTEQPLIMTSLTPGQISQLPMNRVSNSLHPARLEKY